MFKRNCEKIDFKKDFFLNKKKCSFIKRVGAVIFELDEFSTSNFLKFRFQSMTLKI